MTDTAKNANTTDMTPQQSGLISTIFRCYRENFACGTGVGNSDDASLYGADGDRKSEFGYPSYKSIEVKPDS